MEDITRGFIQALQLIFSGDAALLEIVVLSLQVTAVARPSAFTLSGMTFFINGALLRLQRATDG